MNYGTNFPSGFLMPILIMAGIVILGIFAGFYLSSRRKRQLRK